MHRRLWAGVVGVLGLALCDCGSDPGYTVIDRPSVIASEPQATKPESPEAPRKTFIALQTCADRYAYRLASDSHYAVLYDIEATGLGITAVKVKDSMLTNSDLEACLSKALEHMEIPATALNTQHGVTPLSRSAVGIAQAAAAPIALLPIILVAGGVTILVGVTIYVAVEAVKRIPVEDEESDDECTNGYVRCRENPAGGRQGNNWNISICGSCLEVCKRVKSWPVSIPLGNKFVPCF